MADASPDLEDVLDAARTVIAAAALSWSTVLSRELTPENELEGIRRYQELDNAHGEKWSVDLWAVTAEAAPSVAGEGVGETYVIYKVVATYRSVRRDPAAWEPAARAQVQIVANAIDGNPAIFRIDGPPVHGTPETAEVEKMGLELVADMKVFKARLVMNVEGRRLAA